MIKALAQLWQGIANWYSSRKPSRSAILLTLTSARRDYSAAVRRELVAVSRRFAQEDPIVDRMADLFEQYVAGSEITVMSASREEEFAAAATRAWSAWAAAADVGGESLSSLLRTCCRSWFVDGEAFLTLVSDSDRRPRLQAIESHHIATPKDRVDSASLADGAELDENGAVAAWHVVDDSGNFVRRIPAIYVWHLWEPQRVGQLRGVPFVAPALSDLHDLRDLAEYEKQAAKLGATIVGTISTGRTQSLPLNLRREMIAGQALKADGSAGTEAVIRQAHEAFGASIIPLEGESKLEWLKQERPSNSSLNHWRLLEERVCAGVGIPRLLVYPDSLQGTVYRGALDIASAWFRARTAVLHALARSLWKTLLPRILPRARAWPSDWEAVAISSPPLPTADAGRDSQALIRELAAGIRTLRDIHAENGRNWEEALEQRAREIQRLQQLSAQYQIPSDALSTLS